MLDAKISELTPDPSNANKGTQRGLKALDKSLRQYGAGRSILLDRDNRIIAGNKTAERAMDIGLEDVQIVDSDGTKLIAVRRTDLDLEDDGGKARALATYDNRVGQLDLDWDLDALGAIDADILGDLWSDKELSDLGVNLGEPPEDPGAQIDKADELRQKWGVETGQLWRLGEHRLICGDCTDKAVVDALMMGEKAQAVILDPPFAVRDDEWDKFSGDKDFVGFTAEWLLLGKTYADVIVSFMADKNVPQLREAAAQVGLSYRRALIWRKPPGSQFAGASLDGFWYDFEIIQVFGKPAFSPRKDTQMAVLEHRTVTGQEHGCEKPPELLQELVNGYSEKNRLVIDFFSGTGTTLIACERLGRKCRAVEISPGYVAVAIQRWVDMTGGTPELISNT